MENNIDNKNSLFENIFIENPILGHVSLYLELKSINNLVISSKNMYKNHETMFILRYNVLEKAIILIKKYIKQYHRIMLKMKETNLSLYPNNEFKYLNPFYFYRYYPKRYIVGYFSLCKSKLNIESAFFKENNINEDNPKRNDLFNLIRLLSVNQILCIGW